MPPPPPDAGRWRPGEQTEDQSEALAFLASPAAHGGRKRVRRVDTHGAAVFISSRRALKLKRARWFPYMDYSTLARRRRFCEAEVRINKPLAPGIYIAAMPVTRAPAGGLALGGDGPVLDWVVVMNRFRERDLLRERLRRGAVDAPMIDALAATIAAYHGSAEIHRERGGAAAMAAVVRATSDSLGDAPAGLFDGEHVARLARAGQAAAARLGPLMDKRRDGGFVRRCHGDLHLGNIFVEGTKPVLFDAIEFNDDFAIIDTFYDLAFLVMDMGFCRRTDLADRLLNRYLALTGDLEGAVLLPLYAANRAAIRAKVLAAQVAASKDPGTIRRRRRDGRRYLDLALDLLGAVPNQTPRFA